MIVKNAVIVNDFGVVNGGAAQVAVNSALGLAEIGIHVYYFCAVDPIDSRLIGNQGITAISTEQLDILHNTDRLAAAFQGLWNGRAVRIFERLLSSLSPADTIVHIHGWTKALSHSVIAKALKMWFPVIVTLHDYFLACPNGGFYNYQSRQICRLKALSGKCIVTHCDSRSYSHKLWRTLRGMVQKNMARIPAKLKYAISVSDTSLELIRPYLPGSIRVFNLPTPVDALKVERVNVRKNARLIAIGRLSPEKGFDLAATAARELGKEIMFIGDGEQRGKLEKINPVAIFTGWLPHAQLMKGLATARALIFSSTWVETQGLVILEAASRGVPSIVSDVTGGREFISDTQTGLLFKNNDLGDLNRKILKIYDDETVDQLGENAYNRFWNSFPQMNHYTAALADIYLQVLHDHANGRP
ncbi:MAG: glycosyltransferase family 4 protein [Bellilinea sp.]